MQAKGDYNIGMIRFGVLSAREILSQSVCEVTSYKLSSKTASEAAAGTVYDARMGICPSGIAGGARCVTCGHDLDGCPGHPGHIVLEVPVCNPLMMKHILLMLKITCFGCSRLLLTSTQIDLRTGSSSLAASLTGRAKFSRVAEACKTADICSHCTLKQPKLNLAISECLIYASVKDVQHPTLKPEPLSSIDIFRILDGIRDSDVIIAGIDPTRAHPRNLVFRVLPVMATASRPYAVSGKVISDDDLSCLYAEICKINVAIRTAQSSDHPDAARMQKLIANLHFRIQILFRNNGTGKGKNNSTTGRPLKGIVDRITGKQGLIRNHLMGKRCEQTARTVIGAEPTLGMQEFGIPPIVASTLTIPVRIAEYNLDAMQGLVDSGKTNTVRDALTGIAYRSRDLCIPGSILEYGDLIHHLPGRKIPSMGTIRPGGTLFTESALTMWSSLEGLSVENAFVVIDPHAVPFIKGDRVWRRDISGSGDSPPAEITGTLRPQRFRKLVLKIGDIVERHLADGDYVLVNRQPTLHRGSMMAQKVRVLPGKTFRLNLATTPGLNADFDGDEMNIHVVQCLESRAELEELANTDQCLISAATSTPLIAFVQDTMLSVFLMSRDNESIDRATFFDMSMVIKSIDGGDTTLGRIAAVDAVMRREGILGNAPAYTTRGLLALVFPSTFQFAADGVLIVDGVPLAGAITKPILNRSILHGIFEQYPRPVTVAFIDNLQFIATAWIERRSFSIGLQDCICGGNIQAAVSRFIFEADLARRATHTPRLREAKITMILNNALVVGQRISNEHMDPNNGFLVAIDSGAKGALFNISQITSLLGQSIVGGTRIKKTLNNCKRSMPHYAFHLSPEDSFESQGFITSSFAQGLSPREFFFHSMTGREGVADSAIETATSGYSQRRIVKTMEDVTIGTDGTVRDGQRNILSFVYGDMGLNPSMIRKIGEETRTCNAAAILEDANRATAKRKREKGGGECHPMARL